MQKRNDIAGSPDRVRLDMLLKTNYLRDTVCIAFIINEAVSIIENAGIMGVPLPEALKKSIDILEEKNLAMKD